MTKKLVVGCCGCMRVMDAEGKPIGKKVGHGGLMDLDEMAKHFADLSAVEAGQIPTFDGKYAADVAARSFGWKVIDGDHRCPDCIIEPPQVDRAGCYIDWSLMTMTANEQRGAQSSTPEATQ